MPQEDANKEQQQTGGKNKKQAQQPAPAKRSGGKPVVIPTVKAFNDFKGAVESGGAEFKKAEPGQKYDLGGGAVLTILAPVQPFFTKEQLRGGNVPNANSIVARLDYGDFSMLLMGDAETQTEERLLSKGGVPFEARVIKIAHHGSKYATSEDFLKRVKPETAIISDGEYNRYGHPAQVVLDRLKAATIKVYRTDLQGEITIRTKGKSYEVKAGKETKADIWAGREPQKDDSTRSGFIAYGEFGPPPRPKQEKVGKR
jgi:beta-lactamase superfamily II metal-dependent hydrolase